ncbi:hypothetical protein NIES4074_64930 (plasmid) [Cylindrospermum sp. NIES-4074]|nr:hypothetical protein NIES4074_64930 [Cylindrospermum sp. NIES-4074]
MNSNQTTKPIEDESRNCPVCGSKMSVELIWNLYLAWECTVCRYEIKIEPYTQNNSD